MAERQYLSGTPEEETLRLTLQAQILDRSQRRLLEDAGVGPGMRVLDLGSGAGDVALTVAEFVGPTGSVVGVDKNPAILETARERARAAGYANVAFVVRDLDQDLNLEGEFDAVVGRLVLMYLADPAATLRRALRYLRPGGIVVLREPTNTMPFPQAFPPSPLYQRVAEWRVQAFANMGVEPDMGWKLYQTFLDAGLPDPQMRAEAQLFSGSSPGYYPGVLMLRQLRPVLVQHGLAIEEELDPDAINEQLRAEFVAERKVAMSGLGIAAWARKP